MTPATYRHRHISSLTSEPQPALQEAPEAVEMREALLIKNL